MRISTLTASAPQNALRCAVQLQPPTCEYDITTACGGKPPTTHTRLSSKDVASTHGGNQPASVITPLAGWLAGWLWPPPPLAGVWGTCRGQGGRRRWRSHPLGALPAPPPTPAPPAAPPPPLGTSCGAPRAPARSVARLAARARVAVPATDSEGTGRSSTHVRHQSPPSRARTTRTHVHTSTLRVGLERRGSVGVGAPAICS
jgi:hypothetical protein